MKRTLLVTLLIFPFMALAEAVLPEAAENAPTSAPKFECRGETRAFEGRQACIAEPYLVNELEPLLDEPVVKNREVLKGNPFGKITISSEPLGGHNIQKVRLTVHIQCTGSTQKKQLLKVDVCGYQRGAFDQVTYDSNSNINAWIMDPEFNISHDDKSVLMTIRKTSGNACGRSETLPLPVTCP